MAYLDGLIAVWEDVRNSFLDSMPRSTVELWFGTMKMLAFKDDVLTFRTRDEQFSLKGNNKFYYITPCFFGDEFGKLGTLGVKRFVTDDPFEFLNKIKMSEEEFLEYLESI